MARMKKRTFLGLGVAALAPWRLALGQSRYPDRPVRLVVPFAPGGDGDIMGRLWAKYAAAPLGGSIVVENKAGAGGAIGAAEVARARADGYTLLLGTTTTQIINPAASPNPPYDALKDFMLVGMVSVNPTCIIVNPGVPANSLKELVSLVKANPGKYSYGSAGPGTITNLTGELFKLQAGRPGDGACAVQGRRPGDAGPRSPATSRYHADPVVGGARAAPRRTRPHPGREQRPAPQSRARHSDFDRSRRPGHAGAGVQRAVRSRRNARAKRFRRCARRRSRVRSESGIPPGPGEGGRGDLPASERREVRGARRSCAGRRSSRPPDSRRSEPARSARLARRSPTSWAS